MLSEKCSFIGTNDVYGQISYHMFAPSGGCGSLYNKQLIIAEQRATKWSPIPIWERKGNPGIDFLMWDFQSVSLLCVTVTQDGGCTLAKKKQNKKYFTIQPQGYSTVCQITSNLRLMLKHLQGISKVFKN